MKREQDMNRREKQRGRIKESEFWEIIDEMTRLYAGWLAYLLKRLGEEAIHIKAEDITNAMETLAVTSARDEDGYVLTVGERLGKHDRHDRDE